MPTNKTRVPKYKKSKVNKNECALMQKSLVNMKNSCINIQSSRVNIQNSCVNKTKMHQHKDCKLYVDTLVFVY